MDTHALLKTPNLGPGILEDHERVDFATLRRERRARVLEAMDRLDLDACVLGREANVRYVAGARRLWTALSRPFAPTCLVVRRSREVHLLSFSASYEGIPLDLQPDHVYPVTWNPMAFVEHFQGVDGAADARRIGVDGMTSLFDGLLRMAFPSAELVGVEEDLVAVRRHKLPAERDAIRTAAAIAEASLVAAVERLRPGVSEKSLQAAYLARMCELGTSQFAQQGTFTTVGEGGEVRFITGSGPVPAGAAVVLAGGALWAGYEGSLARTWWSGPAAPPAAARSAHACWRDAVAAVVDACRPGTSGRQLTELLTGDGTTVDPLHSAVYSIGLGHEGPVAARWVDPAAAERQVLAAGMVLGVRVLVRAEGRAHLGEEMVEVTDGAPRPLTTLGHGPLAS